MVTKLKLPTVISKQIKGYADYVIHNRAIPDIRDGLKPSQRRILFASFNLGLNSRGRTEKSAKVVGETMGNYHPHGDAPITSTLYGMVHSLDAIPFASNHASFIGQGNFGSIMGDASAANRYTEVKLSPYGESFFGDINYVEMVPNYSENRKEPTVLPASLPNILINGYAGLAVGFSGCIPSCNLNEVADALLAYINDPSKTEFPEIQGPDFCYGGVITSSPEAIQKVFATGHGTIYFRCNYGFEDEKTLVITSLAPKISYDNIINSKEAKQFSDTISIYDESSDSVRIVIKFKDYNIIKSKILPLLKSSVSYNFLTLKGDELIENCNIADIFQEWLNFRLEVIMSRIEDLKRKEQEKIEKTDAILKLLANPNVLNEIILNLKELEFVKQKLSDIELNENQINYILNDVKLAQILRTNREALEAKHNTHVKELARLSKLIPLNEIKTEILALKKQFGRKRQTILSQKVPQPRSQVATDYWYLINKASNQSLSSPGRGKGAPEVAMVRSNKQIACFDKLNVETYNAHSMSNICWWTANKDDRETIAAFSDKWSYVLLKCGNGIKIIEPFKKDKPGIRQISSIPIESILPLNKTSKVVLVYEEDNFNRRAVDYVSANVALKRALTSSKTKLWKPKKRGRFVEYIYVVPAECILFDRNNVTVINTVEDWQKASLDSIWVLHTKDNYAVYKNGSRNICDADTIIDNHSNIIHTNLI